MTNLTHLEKRRLEDLFGMASGYVLNFSNRTFEEFMRDVARVEIYDSKYDYASGSKANRLRAFWTAESGLAVAKVLEALVEVAEYESSPEPDTVQAARGIVERLRRVEGPGRDGAPTGHRTPQPPTLSAAAEPNPRSYEVALSFAGEQRSYVGRVADALRATGVEVFYDEFEDLWGKDLTVELEHVYRSASRYVVIFVSDEYVAKAWPKHERQHALAGRIERQDDSVLPVHFDNAQLPGLPSSIGHLDIEGITPEDLAARIVRKLRGPRAHRVIAERIEPTTSRDLAGSDRIATQHETGQEGARPLNVATTHDDAISAEWVDGTVQGWTRAKWQLDICARTRGPIRITSLRFRYWPVGAKALQREQGQGSWKPRPIGEGREREAGTIEFPLDWIPQAHRHGQADAVRLVEIHAEIGFSDESTARTGTITAGPRLVENVPPLPSEARALLVEAVKDPAGAILRIPGGLGKSTTTFRTNGRAFGREGDPRSEARWEAALDRLEELGLVRDKGHKREVFTVTDAGYKVADAINPASG